MIELILTGDELLSGQTIDTNSAWLGQYLQDYDLMIHYKQVVGDNVEDLMNAFSIANKRSKIILVNGGLGPTVDDLSALSMAKYMSVELELYQEWLDVMQSYFRIRGKVMTDTNKKQAWLPQGSVIIHNDSGTACGFAITYKESLFLFTPGVPHEFKSMFVKSIFPCYFTDWMNIDDKLNIVSLFTLGLGESALAKRLDVLPLPSYLRLGYRFDYPYIELKCIFTHSVSEQDKNLWLHRIYDLVVVDCIVLKDKIPECVHQKLLDKGMTVSFAESCTGGMIMSSLVDFEHSSLYLKGGVVCYQNEIKQDILDVDAQMIAEHGVVSIPVATAMCEGVIEHFQSDFALSITGYATFVDDNRYSMNKGDIVISVSNKKKIATFLLHIDQVSRNKIRVMASHIALYLLLQIIEERRINTDQIMLKNKNYVEKIC